MKFIKRTLFVIALLTLLTFATFYSVEWFKGNKYVDYLSSNSVSLPYSGSHEYSYLDTAIASKQLILVGEIHGFKEPQNFDFEFFKYLYEKHDVRTYLLEMDISQGYFMNEYLTTGNDSLLMNILSNWIVGQGRNNKTYFEKWKKFREWYLEGNDFRFIGLNNLSDYKLMLQHLSIIAPDLPVENYDSDLTEAELREVHTQLSSYLDNSSEEDTGKDILRHIERNLLREIEGTNREEILTENLLNLYEIFNLKEERVYSYMGLGHVLLAPLDGGYKAMALKAAEKDDWFQNRILTMVQLFENSHTVMPSNALPGIMQDDGPYTRVAVSYDDILLSYLYGIGDLKRVAEKESMTIVPIRGKNSPYANSQRLMTMTKLLPVGQILNASEGYNTSEYGHYLLFFRNSDWAEPFDNIGNREAG